MAGEIDDIRQELAATQYWLRMLCLASATGARMDADLVRQTINGVKNFDPIGEFDVEHYDEVASKRMPHIERIGMGMIEVLERSS